MHEHALSIEQIRKIQKQLGYCNLSELERFLKGSNARYRKEDAETVCDTCPVLAANPWKRITLPVAGVTNPNKPRDIGHLDLHFMDDCVLCVQRDSLSGYLNLNFLRAKDHVDLAKVHAARDRGNMIVEYSDLGGEFQGFNFTLADHLKAKVKNT